MNRFTLIAIIGFVVFVSLAFFLGRWSKEAPVTTSDSSAILLRRLDQQDSINAVIREENKREMAILRDSISASKIRETNLINQTNKLLSNGKKEVRYTDRLSGTPLDSTLKHSAMRSSERRRSGGLFIDRAREERPDSP